MLGAALIWPQADPAAASEQKRMDVLELFTSQGCSSCPPADLLLGSYAKRPDVLALSFPVSYWDHLGWKDTLAKDSYNDRQRSYAEARGDREIYTPQLVVNGMVHAVGSQRGAVEAALKKSSHALAESWVPVSMSYAGGSVQLDAGAAPAGSPYRSGTLWLAFYSDSVTVPIVRGENNGREITYTNVVRQLLPAGPWNGQAARYDVKIPRALPYDGCAALLQSDKTQMVIGAAKITSPEK
ncbi:MULTISPECIES: DUF1223 domain-containing protein [Rhodomicrobium]|uniref:DUF1223 domain-containing protein n=1 Tax=Rhodomicrobium TaxID=1068 RepID=UPI001483045C|nr:MULTISPECIES: DUF1223 domain-containing protein [Rhodomicrobium]